MSKELNAEDLKFRSSLVFAKSPYDKIVISRLEYPIIESKLRIDPPSKCSVRHSKIESFIFPKSDISKLVLEPPSGTKEVIKIQEEKNVKLSSNEAISKKVSEHHFISKEDWENREFIKLEKWFLIPDKSSSAVIIGYRPDIEEFWMSDLVFARIDANRIITQSKTCYQLIGKIDSLRQKSKLISANFETGFPENWKEFNLRP